MAVIIDRRTTRHKNAGNVDRFIKRHEDVIKDTIEGLISDINISDIDKIKAVKIPLYDHEFSLGHTHNTIDHVFIGNRKYKRGDKIPKNKVGGIGQGGGNGKDKAIDDPSIIINRDEIEKYLFSECELPNWVEKTNPCVKDYKQVHAGYKRSGLPGTIDIRRSVKNGIGRNLALLELYDEEIAIAESEMAFMTTQELLTAQIQQIADLKQLKENVLWIEEMDLRFKHKTAQPNFISKGVIFLCMDVSASMDRGRLELCHLFFTLTTLFLTKFYESIEIVFIKFATDACVCSSEKEFFNNDMTGGTSLSAPLIKVNQLIESKYKPNEYNIYVIQTSDTEDYDMDIPIFENELMKIIGVAQMMIYVHIDRVNEVTRRIYNKLMNMASSNKKLAVCTIEYKHHVIPAFTEIFKKKG